MFNNAITLMRNQMARVQGAAEMYQAMSPQQTPRSSSSTNGTSAASTPPTRTDGVSLSNEAQQSSSPYSNSGFGATRVTIQPNDNLDAILRKQGFSTGEIYGKDAQGSSLMDRVSSANNLRDPNLISSGSSLTIPRRGESQEGSSSVGSASGSVGASVSSTAGSSSPSVGASVSGSVGGSVSSSSTSQSNSGSGFFENLGREADSGVQTAQSFGEAVVRSTGRRVDRAQQWGRDVGNDIEAVDMMINDSVSSVTSGVSNWFNQNVANPISANFTEARARARAND